MVADDFDNMPYLFCMERVVGSELPSIFASFSSKLSCIIFLPEETARISKHEPSNDALS
jgi:hypothetical protein